MQYLSILPRKLTFKSSETLPCLGFLSHIFHSLLFRPASRQMIFDQLHGTIWNATYDAHKKLLDHVFAVTETTEQGWELIGTLDTVKVLREIKYDTDLQIHPFYFLFSQVIHFLPTSQMKMSTSLPS